MINLRYHIVSITAVFLALGIGLTLGSSFLDRVTVDNLKDRLDRVQERVEKAETANDGLTERVGALDERDEALAAELPERMLAGRLTDVPVLVIATEGTDEALVDRTVAALAASGARITGSWWLTDRWALDDAEEVSDLSALLGLSSEDPVRLRRNASLRMVEFLNDASQEPPLADPATPDENPASRDESVEPPVVASLEGAGFIEYRAVAGSGDKRVLLPAASTRYVMVSGALPGSGPQRIVSALLDGIVADGPAPVVAAQGAVDLPDTAKPNDEDARRSTFVGPLRQGDFTGQRLSTVDTLDTAAGLGAIVLAVEDLADMRTGHYGVGPGASRLLPGAEQPA